MKLKTLLRPSTARPPLTGKPERYFPTIFLLGVRVDNIDLDTALNIVHAYAAHPNGPPSRRVFFTNVHTIIEARRNRELHRAVSHADLVLPDGTGLRMAGRALGRPILANLNGTDLLPRILRRAEGEGWSVYLLGARRPVVERCAERLQAAFPALRIVGAHDGYFTPAGEQAVIDDINAAAPHLLLVALGSPRQELWIFRNAHRLRAGVAFAVGGLFDFLSGAVPRAPRWMRRAGLEWLYRFARDPREKWRRVAWEIPMFLGLLTARTVIPASVRGRLVRRIRR